MTRRPTPTLHDVALRAQVSTATVSRTLNFPDQVSPRTRDQVMAAVTELGYSPNFGARAMAARRTNTIGAVIPTMENAIFARGLQAFQDELRVQGFTMLVASTNYRRDVEDEQIRSLVARGADALLLIGHDRDPDLYRFLDTQGIPTLVTWAYDPAAPRPSVGFDNRAAMAAMVREVIAQGHRRLALISARIAGNDRVQARIEGLKDAMRDAGLSTDDLPTIETTYGFAEGARAFADLMARPEPPTAMICGNDVIAIGAMGQAADMGLSVPGDVSIVGFDDTDLAQVARPSLTTVHVPHRDMGRRAARTLAQMVKEGITPTAVELPTQVVLRGTLGPPKTSQPRPPESV